jgi:hypothetical protein
MLGHDAGRFRLGHRFETRERTGGRQVNDAV